MRKNRFILRCAAFFMLLVFSQKAGAGLFIHNLLHTSTATSSAADGHDTQQGFNYTCSCADDFIMPFTGADEITCSIPLFVNAAPLNFMTAPALLDASILSFLRGPPVFKK